MKNMEIAARDKLAKVYTKLREKHGISDSIVLTAEHFSVSREFAAVTLGFNLRMDMRTGAGYITKGNSQEKTP